MQDIFFEITVIICIAAVFTIIFRIFKQPAVLAYILTGILLGPIGIFQLENHEALQTLGQVGITLLLFILGLELRISELRSIGKIAVVAGGLQMLATLAVGYIAATLLGFSSTVSLYIGIALGFSSTVIIVKILSDKRDLTSLHGKIAIGILLMQDFFAIMTIVFLSGTDTNVSGSVLLANVGLILLKVILLFGWILVISQYVFPKIIHVIAKSSESLFLFSLAWVFLLTAFVTWKPIGFSIEIGGFLAGLALAGTAENFHIVSKMRSLRDFFITIFFVMLGLEMTFVNFGSVILPAIILSLFVLIGKPIIIMTILGSLGYKKRTGFFSGTLLGQVSEFSLIILFLGSTAGIIPSEVVTLMVLVSIITFVGSTYIIQNANKVYKKINQQLLIFEFKNTYNEQEGNDIPKNKVLDKHVVVIGAHQMGQSVIRALEKSGEDVIAVDFNPDIVAKLREKKIPVLFGDISDTEIQEKVNLHVAKLVISTIPDLEDNLLLIESLNKLNKKAKIVVMAYEVANAKVLYKAGADYVVLPHLAGGRHLAKILIENKHLELIEDYKEHDMKSWI